MKVTCWVTVVPAQCQACPEQCLDHRHAEQVQDQQQAAAQLRRQSRTEQQAATSAAAIFKEGSRQARQHSEQAMQWVRPFFIGSLMGPVRTSISLLRMGTCKIDAAVGPNVTASPQPVEDGACYLRCKECEKRS